MNRRKIKLGYHCHIPALVKNGKIIMPGHIGFFIDNLAKLCEEIICFQHTPRKDEIEQMDYEIQSENIKLVSMGLHSKIPVRTIKAFLKGGDIKKYREKVDAVIVRTPTPLVPLFNLWFNEKVVLFIVGDYLMGVDSLNLPRWKKILVKQWSKWIDKVQKKILRQNISFVNGRKLFLELRNEAFDIYETRTTTLRKKDFFVREDTCIKAPYKLLYCGRLIREKGLFELLEAFINLSKSGMDLVLNLVGPTEKGDNSLDVIMQIAKEKRIEEKIEYFGYQPAGEKLLTFYRQADIFIYPTKIVSETYPRTIREAMSSSVPVISTSVGSIPYYISHCAVLIKPGEIKGLEEGIKRIINNGEFRRELIRKGMEAVKNDNVEDRAEELIKKISESLEKKQQNVGEKGKEYYGEI